MHAPENRPLLLIVTGPAGSGKTTLSEQMVRQFAPQLQRVVTTTTRPMRKGEIDGVDYHFLTTSLFEAHVAAGDFYEYATVHGEFAYGALKSEIDGKLGRGTDLILNVDVQGVSHYRNAAMADQVLRERLVTIFIMPRDLDQLRERLSIRNKDAAGEIARRIRTAEAEVQEWRSFDYCFVSADRDADFRALQSIYLAEKLRVGSESRARTTTGRPIQT